jgi:hypothetical protein
MDNKNESKRPLGRPRKKRSVGRPKLPEGTNQKYQRIAIYPETYLILKKRSILENKTISDLIKEHFNKW